jgi:hypothetical protein
MKQSDFLPGQAPSWCQSLEGNFEYTTRSFYAMGFDSLEFVYSDACYGGHLKINANNDLVEGQPGYMGGFDGPHSDMSIALGMGETSKTRFYQGWYDKAWFSPFDTEKYCVYIDSRLFPVWCVPRSNRPKSSSR